MKKENKKNIAIIIILFTILLVFFVINYINKELEEYKSYADFTMASDVMLLSFNKNFDLQYPLIRKIQSSTDEKKETEGSLIYDFAQYDMLPIFNYLVSDECNHNLITSFTKFTDFLTNFNSAIYNRRENILDRLDGDNYYKFENDVYIYKVKKKVIKKEFFEKVYNEYLKSIDENNTKSNFINKLYKNKDISDFYSYSELKDNIDNNYDIFYIKNKETVLNVIAEDLESFCKYLNDKVLYISGSSMPTLKIEEKNIETEVIEIYYNFTKLDRIYSSASKYYKYSYQLNIQYVWNQLKELGYPKLYL